MMSCFIQSCFYPNTSDEEVEKILKSNGKHGSFLLWRRNRQNGYHCHYILSVKSSQRIIHMKMQYVNGCYSMCGEEEFESPYDVIQNCMENADVLKEKGGNIIELKQPVINSEKPTRWYHSNIYPKDAEKILNSNGKHGSYLVRGSYRHPGDYVLCVRLEDKIICIKIYSNGEKYHIGAGKKFNSIGDLIVHYKEHPVKTVEGTDIHLDQGIDSDSVTVSNPALLPNSLPSDITDHDELLSQNTPTPTRSTVNIQKRYNDTSTEALLQAVERNGKYTLSLKGNDVKNPDTWFKECSHTYRNEDGSPGDTVYSYECQEYPGHYIHWYYEEDTVDCETKKDGIPVQFQWSKILVGNSNWLRAYKRNPSGSSPAYLTFKDDQPVVLEDIVDVIEWDISYYDAN